MRMQTEATDPVNQQVQHFLDNVDSYVCKDSHLEVVQSYNSARTIYHRLAQAGLKLDRSMLSTLFSSQPLKDQFKIQPSDELITYTSVNGNKARSKFSPAINVQAMMTYELMKAGLGCAFFLESRDIRMFDSHYSRQGLWRADGTPVGEPNQENMTTKNLWDPLTTLVGLLKSTQYEKSGKSLYDHTNFVINSEFGRTIHGDVDDIVKMPIPEDEKKKMIAGQDISQHWKVTSAAFMGGKVKGNQQFGKVGPKTLMAIPLMPDGSMDPAFDPNTGEVIAGKTPSPLASVPDHGDVYATALYLSDINPTGHGRNERPPMKYIKA
ncbi:MAG: hypothetical protein LC772_12550, partial [Chloroflexi bacterium]|nr:hypothetical protein [Chloroflexota bacterium]